MPVHLDIAYPDDNEISLSPTFLAESNGSVEVRGRGNHLLVEAPLLPNAAHIVLSGGATVIVRMDSNLNALEIHALAEGARIEIGAWASFEKDALITAHEASSIRIGNFCLFGTGCRISSSDVHKVIDLETGQRLNPAGDIAIADHVWAATNVTILRNAVIGKDSIVGAGALVRSAFPANVSLAGVPARVIRTGVTWEF